MEHDTVNSHYKVIADAYPGMNVTQLGLVCVMLGAIRSSMGHENAIGTIENYIHKDMLSQEVRECIDYLEREVLAIKKSKIDIDYWKRGNEGAFRRDEDKVQA